MANTKDGYYVTPTARKRFRKWLVDQDITFNEFCKRAGGTRQYMDRIIKGKVKVTPKSREWFIKGGYTLL